MFTNFASASLFPTDSTPWQSKLHKRGYLNSPLVEVTPFVFKDRLYRLENWQKFWERGGLDNSSDFRQDEVRIRDMETGELISIPLRGHAFGTAFVWEDRVYVFAGDYGHDKPWRAVTQVTLVSSSDLINWSPPLTALTAQEGEHLFNFAVCRGRDQFVMLYETDDPSYPPFTFKYCVSDDLERWRLLPEAIYGRDKYVGGPALYFEGDTYYTLYLCDMGGSWETRITRSKDLVHWEDAPESRPFVTFDSTHGGYQLRPAHVREINASDAELCSWRGKTIVYFTGGDQEVAGDLQWAEFDGTPCELLEHYFE